VHWKIRVPSPRRAKEWEEFWIAYRAEKKLLDVHYRGDLTETVKLPLLNIVLHPRLSRRLT
jgi:hypothetical protein